MICCSLGLRQLEFLLLQLPLKQGTFFQFKCVITSLDCLSLFLCVCPCHLFACHILLPPISKVWSDFAGDFRSHLLGKLDRRNVPSFSPVRDKSACNHHRSSKAFDTLLLSWLLNPHINIQFINHFPADGF